MNYYYLGFIVGLVVTLAISLLVFFAVRRKTGKSQYDERQIAGRGKAYQAGFFTLLIAETLCSVAEHLGWIPDGGLLLDAGAMLLSIAVFAIRAIHLDAYIAMNDNAKRFYIMGTAFTAAMVCTGLANLNSQRSLSQNTAIINFMIAGLWVLILMHLFIHRCRTRETEEV